MERRRQSHCQTSPSQTSGRLSHVLVEANALPLPGSLELAAVTTSTNTSEQPKSSAATVSVVVPVYNEEENLPILHERLSNVLSKLGRTWEVVYVDDGSSDGSLAWLQELAAREPRVQVVELSRNFGQHPAILAGFSVARGDIVVTLDADLQNPPEEIPKLIETLEQGNFDVVGGWRTGRHDPWVRQLASRLVNTMTRLAIGSPIHDHGCMLRAYRRAVVEEIVACDERSSFIPALAQALAKRSTEIPVAHAARLHGTSKYSILNLLRLTFDLLTGFSLLPIQLVSLTGVVVALGGVAFGIFLFVRRLIVGPEAEGLFTLFAILFVCLGILIFAVGVVGEYVGRIFLEVRRRPTYRIRAVHAAKSR
jgi:undecaprenyl-phosphate 4-deoxy-4-formamido-L-arabinose transferase